MHDDFHVDRKRQQPCSAQPHGEAGSHGINKSLFYMRIFHFPGPGTSMTQR
jgi:hypothetical protein